MAEEKKQNANKAFASIGEKIAILLEKTRESNIADVKKDAKNIVFFTGDAKAVNKLGMIGNTRQIIDFIDIIFTKMGLDISDADNLHGKDINEALKMRIYDLVRQWQMGEFDGNDAAAAVSVRCKYRQKNIAFPNEYEIERDYKELTPYVRLEAAMHYIQMLKSNPDNVANVADVIGELRSRFPLNTDFLKCGVDNKNIKDFVRPQNTRLLMMAKAFGDKAFDGYNVYCN